MGKLMEKMVAVRLNWFLESNKILADTQFGFRQALSTTNPILKLQSHIFEAFSRNQIVVSVFFDIKKAYDTTWRRGLVNDLHLLGIRGNLGFFLADFLRDRTLRVRLDSTLSGSYPMSEGIPQGSVLSVLCFGIAINGIANCIPADINHNMYVDDICISKAASRPSAAVRQIQRTIDNMVRWASQKGFTFSSEKTVYMIFKRNRRKICNNDIVPSLNGVPIRRVNEQRFLGVHFDERLRWTSHIKNLKNSCNKPLSLLSHLSHTSWGADRKTLTILYNSLVQSKLDYGCQAYGSAAAHLLRSLDGIRNKGLRLITGAFRSSPVVSLHAEVNMLPPDLNRTFILYKWYLQMLQRDTISLPLLLDFDKYIPTLSPYYDVKQLITEVGNISVSPLELGDPAPWLIPEIKICRFCKNKKDIDPIVLLNEFLEHKQMHVNSIEVFTDGSKSNHGVGAAAVIPLRSMGDSASLHKETSIFSAELIAITFATRLIDLIPHENNEFTIYCDSLSVLQALSKFNPRHPKVNEIQKWLFRTHNLYKRCVKFCWSPGHIGIGGNEQADTMAKNSIRQNVRPCSLFYRNYFSAAYKILYRKFQNRWDDLDNNKLRLIKPSLSKWSSSFQPHRKDEVQLCRLRIGHTFFTHSYLMNKDPIPVCPFCNDHTASIRHIFTSCGGTYRLRRQLFPNSIRLNEDERLKYILSDSDHFNMNNISTFISDLNISV